MDQIWGWWIWLQGVAGWAACRWQPCAWRAVAQWFLGNEGQRGTPSKATTSRDLCGCHGFLGGKASLKPKTNLKSTIIPARMVI